MRCLLVEDNEDLAGTIADYLDARGLVVDIAGDGRMALGLLADEAYDVVVLDLGLPDVDGLDLCRHVRESRSADLPVLMLTARDTVSDKLAGFQAGTDDYLVKPFALQELAARLQALVRRASRASAGRLLQVSDLFLDLDTLEVTRAGREIRLPPIPLRILTLLIRNGHRVVPRREIEEEIWGDEPPDSDALKVHLHVLRNAIDRPFDTPLLRTVAGAGYRLAPPTPDES